MNADNDYQIGHDHIICEDYALSGVKEDGTEAHIIISDGCSASRDVDFGARVLALSARELLSKLDMPVFKKKDGTIGYLEFGSQIIQRANVIPPLFPLLNSGSLDATLLVAWINNGILKVYMYGDGVFFRKTKDGIHVIHISFDNSAPNYLSYLLDSDRKQVYEKMGGKKEITNCIFVDGKVTTVSVTQVPSFEPVIFESVVEEGNVVSLCSDGINSFKKSDSSPIEWQDLISEYVGFKNFEGAFVKRRFGAFKRKCIRDGITHGDDISIASMIV